MVREVEPSNLEEEFLLEALKEGERLDTRGLLDGRKIQLEAGASEDCVECCLGQSRVAAHVSAEVVRPRTDRPFEGFIQVTTEISPMASYTFEFGRSSEDEVLISRMLEKALKRSGAVDQEALCIVAGEKVWSLRVDVLFLNDEGNLLDCASIAAIAALRLFRRSDVSVVGEEVTIHPADERIPVSLALHHSPICISFALFDTTSPLVLLDPSHLEERLADGVLTVVLNAQREVCVFNKSGGAPLSVDEIMRAVGIASVRVKDVDALIEQLVVGTRAPIDKLKSVQSR